jgi:diacylglycerol kinase (ATP)
VLKLWRAFLFSLAGLKSAFHHERAIRLETLMIIIGVPFGLYFGHSPAEHALLIGSLLLVMIIELINTAIERVTDRISTERHDLSKQAKDAGSAAVFVSIILAAMVWGLVLVG